MLKYPEHSPVTIFKTLHQFVLDSYLYFDEPVLIALMKHAEGGLLNKKGFDKKDKKRLGALLDRVKPIRDFEHGPGTHIKYFLKE